jgi:O-acetyl-ADP-ribose deacetylase (regulator of RNase III)
MNQCERRQFLIRELLQEAPQYRRVEIPADSTGQRTLLRSLMNVRSAAPISQEFQEVQDAYLQEENRRRGTVALSDLQPLQKNLYLWRGDITTLQCGAIVNAANSGMTGCYQPCHSCIDNCIHTYAGIQLRNFCQDLMDHQGFPEPTGQAKITPAFNLPCDYVLHTVGPIVDGPLTDVHRRQLASCYRSCLELAEKYLVKSIAFCCISTGVFRFPNADAADIAVKTVTQYQSETGSEIQVIFNVFKELDEQLYRTRLASAL